MLEGIREVCEGSPCSLAEDAIEPLTMPGNHHHRLVRSLRLLRTACIAYRSYTEMEAAELMKVKV